jgi:hypothetical protein
MQAMHPQKPQTPPSSRTTHLLMCVPSRWELTSYSKLTSGTKQFSTQRKILHQRTRAPLAQSQTPRASRIPPLNMRTASPRHCGLTLNTCCVSADSAASSDCFRLTTRFALQFHVPTKTNDGSDRRSCVTCWEYGGLWVEQIGLDAWGVHMRVHFDEEG